MRTQYYQFPASRNPARRAHVGVVGSGDLEVLLEPGTADGVCAAALMAFISLPPPSANTDAPVMRRKSLRVIFMVSSPLT